MFKKTSATRWKNYFEDRGLPAERIELYLPYIKKLNSNSAPVIFEFEHLSYLLGIKKSELAKIVNCPESYHRIFSIPKRCKGKREIVAPYPSLLHCQDWIYKNILIQQPIHDCAHGFVPGRSIFTNASKHLSKKALLKMDLKNFFPSIPINWIIKYFLGLGYADNVSFYLASLCCYNNFLSQGSSTSPYLTNILLFRLDQRLKLLASTYKLEYTRYADDLAFSGAYIPHEFSDYVSNIIESYGLTVNKDKTKLHCKEGQRIVTGLSVTGPHLRIPRKTKRQLKQEVFFIKKYGYLSHANKLKINNPYYLESLIGKLQFWLQAEPANTFARNSIALIKSMKN